MKTMLESIAEILNLDHDEIHERINQAGDDGARILAALGHRETQYKAGGFWSTSLDEAIEMSDAPDHGTIEARDVIYCPVREVYYDRRASSPRGEAVQLGPDTGTEASPVGEPQPGADQPLADGSIEGSE